MYPKGYASQYRQEFFEFLKLKMSRRLSSEKVRINWMKYKTGVDDLYFRCEIDRSSARFCIDIQHRDPGVRELVYNQFLEMKTVLHQHVGEMYWLKDHHTEDGLEISRIYAELPEANLFEKESWPEAFEFFEKKLRKMDKTWSMAKFTFFQLLK
ncbi:MAG: DUF4268 domain-containing protein [Flavobacteriales bacterium]|nr:hypothetical protein [Flavobacteriales bacterium]HCA82670.1 hypothetical protein [Flavobacteriales bacterium]HRE76064.1 DUF4268 domain-containing protein [Flavobacteriales bacterium]HRE97133.1 DUF4268 domain-containing protein [Flavobacteriales bacterium]HRJ35944.1 DUF4268 domain-containing protein [Flavobacteriales bacterium]